MKAAKTVAMIVLAFLVCWIPSIILPVLGRLRSDKSWGSGFLAQYSVYISSGINPIIYSLRTRRFRRALKQFLKDPFGRSPFEEADKGVTPQREIARRKARQIRQRNRIVPEPAERDLTPEACVSSMDRQAGSTTEAQGERGLSVQDSGREASRPRMRNHKVSPLTQKQESGRDRLAWAEVHHVHSGGINS